MIKFKELIETLQKYPSNDVYLKHIFIETLIEMDKVFEKQENALTRLEKMLGAVMGEKK